MKLEESFRVLVIHLDEAREEIISFGTRQELIGGSGLAAALYDAFGLPDQPAGHPDQPLIFAIGSLTGLFPLMSKVVCGFKSPYHQQYAESHAGGRLALSMRFAGLDALVIRGRARTPSCLTIGPKGLAELSDVHYLWGMDVFHSGKMLRKMHPGHSGHRSVLRIGPAGEKGLAFACINVDTYRHFGRLGAGAVMGGKNLKAIIVRGDQSFELPGKTYPALYQKIHQQTTSTRILQKYHDLGTAENLQPLNELQALPWRNLTQTRDSGVANISGEAFAQHILLRQMACAGCPIGCIHVGMLREQFAEDTHFQYREVGYDYEPIYAVGSMLGITSSSEILAILDEVEKVGVDVMSCGVALAWATEALERGLLSLKETLVPLAFGQADGYRQAVSLLGTAANDFYRRLGRGTLQAAQHFGGADFACVLGQEMAGYATGEVFFTSQALGFRHSHLDSGGYSYDQTHPEKDSAKAVRFLIDDERSRALLTSTVACLFARKVYSEEVLADCFTSIGLEDAAKNLGEIAAGIQKSRWKTRFRSGFDPLSLSLPKRFTEVKNWKGPVDGAYLERLRLEYAQAIKAVAES